MKNQIDHIDPSKKPLCIFISGGGTGGHVFPAISIARSLNKQYPNIQIVFIGAQGRMEMTHVPQAGYPIIGLSVRGLRRGGKSILINFIVLYHLIRAIFKSLRLIYKYKPKVVIGTGGYVCAPVVVAAIINRIPTLIQEQNSYPGITNRILGRYVHKICVAYPNMERYFPSHKIKVTGNPVRVDILSLHHKRDKAIQAFDFNKSNRTLLILGGSLGSKTINTSISNGLDRLIQANLQIIWQTGKADYETIQKKISHFNLRYIRILDFITQMDLAYAAADIVISRAGAMALSELCITGHPCILVPSSNVTNNHQFKNADVMEKEGAAMVVQDERAGDELVDKIFELLTDKEKYAALQHHIKRMRKPQASHEIINQVNELICR